MNHKKLQLNEPAVKCYQFDAYLSCILADHPYYGEWLYSRYILLEHNTELYKKDGKFNLFFTKTEEMVQNPFDCVLAEQKKIDLDCGGESGFTDAVAGLIDDGFFVYTFVNEYYIENRYAYQRCRMLHDILIYGYDRDTGIFNIYGYDNTGQINETTVTFGALYRAYVSLCDEERRTLAARKNPAADYTLDLPKIAELIGYYLEGKAHPSLRYREYNIYGMEIYGPMKAVLRNAEKALDLRGYYLFYEHKKVMHKRLLYLAGRCNSNELSGLAEAYGNLQDEANNIVNLVMKFNMTSDKRALLRAVGKTEAIQEKETVLLGRLHGLLGACR